MVYINMRVIFSAVPFYACLLMVKVFVYNVYTTELHWGGKAYYKCEVSIGNYGASFIHML